MVDPLPRLTDALADRYRLARDIGMAGMVTVYPRAFNRRPPEVACAA